MGDAERIKELERERDEALAELRDHDESRQLAIEGRMEALAQVAVLVERALAGFREICTIASALEGDSSAFRRINDISSGHCVVLVNGFLPEARALLDRLQEFGQMQGLVKDLHEQGVHLRQRLRRAEAVVEAAKEYIHNPIAEECKPREVCQPLHKALAAWEEGTG